jgi:bis(5'-nucleosidyl)-tetraphosphatase
MLQLKSCGIICFRRHPKLEFLIMEHTDRLDWPKGHILPGEMELECALRECEEETCIPRNVIHVDPHFRHELKYHTSYRRFGDEEVEKTLVLFLGLVPNDIAVSSSEHPSYQWMEWAPPHRIQEKSIDPALKAVELYWSSSGTQIGDFGL